MKTLFGILKKAVLIMALMSMCMALPIPAQDFRPNIQPVRAPEQLASWLSENFEYWMAAPDTPQTPDQMRQSRRGDCDDFAVLASEELSRMGVRNDIIVIAFKDLRIKHAICAWRANDGTYVFISNVSFYRSGENDLVRAVKKFYPDWEKIMIVNARRESIETIALAS